MEDYFVLLSLKREFNIDPAQLKSAYRRNLAAHHPDRAKSNKEAAKLTAKSSLINAAYQHLRDPARRALHLLELDGIDIDSAKYKDRITPAELAEFLEELEIVGSMNDKDKIKSILNSKLAAKDEILQNIAQSFESGNIDLVITLLLRLRYVLRLAENIEKNLK